MFAHDRVEDPRVQPAADRPRDVHPRYIPGGPEKIFRGQPGTETSGVPNIISNRKSETGALPCRAHVPRRPVVRMHPPARKECCTARCARCCRAPDLGARRYARDHRSPRGCPSPVPWGARPVADLERLVDLGEYQLAFAMQPVKVDTVLSIADAGGVMPPKSTWFEPKLLSGLVVHTFD